MHPVIRKVLLGGGVRNPLQIFGPNLSAWYRADMGVFSDAGTTPAADAETVQQWNDLSPHGNNLSQATAGNRPTFDADGLNGRPTISFTASGSDYMTTAAQVIPSANTTISCFAVCQMLTGTSAFGRASTFTTEALLTTEDHDRTTAACLLLRDNANNAFSAFFNNAARDTQSISLATNYRLGVIFDGSNCTTYINNASDGSPATSVTPNFGAAGALRVGVQFSGGPNAFWDGPISEIVMVKTAATQGERDVLDSYFRKQWGV